MKKKAETKEYLKLELHSSFGFTYIENAQNVAFALIQAGYFANMMKVNGSYQLDIYKRA